MEERSDVKGKIYRVPSHLRRRNRAKSRKIRIIEHKRCIALGYKTSNISVYHIKTKHKINWESGIYLDFASNYTKEDAFLKVSTRIWKRRQLMLAVDYRKRI